MLRTYCRPSVHIFSNAPLSPTQARRPGRLRPLIPPPLHSAITKRMFFAIAFLSPSQSRHPRSSSSGRRRSRSRILGIPVIPHPSGFGDRLMSILGCLGRSVVRPLILLASSYRLPRLLKLDVSVVFVWSETFTADDSRHSPSTYPSPVRFWRAVVRSNFASGVLPSTSPLSPVLDTPHPWCSRI
ncbi:hypothetical protein FKP32DRAFT_1175070 [Trametes sanguinea]|nr:hypothetical protein FKP32DRAFT_1175070 [Trametes sanguinea]